MRHIKHKRFAEFQAEGLCQQEYRACYPADFAVADDHKVELKESEKMDKYLDLARERKNCGK